MSKSKEKYSSEKETGFDFSDKKVVIDLIANQRVPIVVETTQSERTGPLEKVAVIIVPPDGTRIGDQTRGSVAFGVRFTSPDGQINRGSASFHNFKGDLNKLNETIIEEVKRLYPDNVRTGTPLYKPSPDRV